MDRERMRASGLGAWVIAWAKRLNACEWLVCSEGRYARMRASSLCGGVRGREQKMRAAQSDPAVEGRSAKVRRKLMAPFTSCEWLWGGVGGRTGVNARSRE